MSMLWRAIMWGMAGVLASALTFFARAQSAPGSGWAGDGARPADARAEALLDAVVADLARSRCLEMRSYGRRLVVQVEADGTTRLATDAEAGMGRRSFVTTMVSVLHRPAEDWRVTVLSEAPGDDASAQGTRMVLAKLGFGDAEVMRWSSTTKSAQRRSVPAVLWARERRTFGGSILQENPVASGWLGMTATPRGGAAVFGLMRPVVSGEDRVGGVPAVRLSAHDTRFGGQAWIWIDEEKSRILRIAHFSVGMSPRTDRLTVLTDLVYSYEEIASPMAADFSAERGWKMTESGATLAGVFPPIDSLFALLSDENRVLAARRQNRQAPTPTPTPPASAEPEIQALSHEQMESIVLIQGDEGVGTGFVAKIRDVPFVVTNQHVIGGNDTVRANTIRGTAIPIAGYFGAKGRDVAILRIQGEIAAPSLKIADDPLKTVKIGDKVAVVGNRRGGGVATQVTGVVRGIGPDRIEVDAPFQPGNSGSPIIHVPTGEVIGVASYSERRVLDELDGPAGASNSTAKPEEKKEEQRWFGFRVEGVEQWEAIDLVRWRAQAKKLAEFETDTEAIWYAMYARFKQTGESPRVSAVVGRFLSRYEGKVGVPAAQEVQEYFRSLRTVAESGVKELKTGDYYDFFRTSDYWETSINQQLRARADIAERLDKASANSMNFISRLRNGN